MFPTVKWSERSPGESSSQLRGVETDARGIARVEISCNRGGTAVISQIINKNASVPGTFRNCGDITVWPLLGHRSRNRFRKRLNFVPGGFRLNRYHDVKPLP